MLGGRTTLRGAEGSNLRAAWRDNNYAQPGFTRRALRRRDRDDPNDRTGM